MSSVTVWSRILTFLLLMGTSSFGAYTLHVYSPWADDGDKSSWGLFITGGGSGWGASTDTEMTDEGGGWYSYTFRDDPLTDWWDWEIWVCPPGDQNCNGKEVWTGTGSDSKEKLVGTFGPDKEIWLSPNADGTYTKSFAAPDAKIIWYKSPWGNRLVPTAVFGSDTVKMRPAEDASMCGWFYSYRRTDANYNTVQFLKGTTRFRLPESGAYDLSAQLAASDTVFVDATGENVLVGGFTSLGACFDKSYTIHVMHPFPDSVIQRENNPGISISDNVMNQAKATEKDNVPYWYKMDFPEGFGFKNGNVSFHGRDQWNNYNVTHPNSFSASELFGNGVYEVWVFYDSDGTLRVSSDPIEVRYIRFLNIWENTSPRITFNGEVRKLRTVENRCGWFETILFEYPGTFKAKFHQALGSDTYGNLGGGDTTSIILDSAFTVSDTAWIYPMPYPVGPAAVEAEFPGILGDCPVRELAVIMYDQADLGGNDDFEDPPCKELQTGLVETSLGIDGLPIAVPGGVPGCTLVDLPSWFKAKEIVPGYTNATCRDLTLNLDEDGFWLADIDWDPENGVDGFFPLDDFTHLDDAGTVPNPYWQKGYRAASMGEDLPEIEHNFHFTMHVNASFEYVPGQYFEFRGDDDVWVFIDNELVVDLGGLHAPEEGSVNLDTLGLTPGATYAFAIFFAERNTVGSNFKMRTSINLETERSYYKQPKADAPEGTIGFEIFEIVREEGLSCGGGADTEVPPDTVRATSNIILTGPHFGTDQAVLKAGTNYGGIWISENRDAFVIDTNAIIANRALAPGTYKITFSSFKDASLSESMLFVVPTYPLATIAWRDSLWQPYSPVGDSLGTWAFISYPVYIEAQYVGMWCQTCVDELELKSSDSLIFMDENKNPLEKVTLDSGRAVVYVMAIAEVKGASFTVSGSSIENVLEWTNINLKEPPVPIGRWGEMHDRDGNGIADSLIIAYTRPITEEDTPDSIGVKWGEDADWIYFSKADVEGYRANDSFFVVTGEVFGSEPYTGRIGQPYRGNSISYFTYIPEDGDNEGVPIDFPIEQPINDSVPPIILEAEVGLGDGFLDTLFVYPSESFSAKKDTGIFEVQMFRNSEDQLVTLEPNSSIWDDDSVIVFLFQAEQVMNPRAGDSIRIVPGAIDDLSGNLAHKNNPLVKIMGRKRAEVDAVNYVKLDPDSIRAEGKNVLVEVVSNTMTAKEVYAQIKHPGFLIQTDLGDILANDPNKGTPEALTIDDVSLSYEAFFYSNLGNYVTGQSGSIKCTDEIFEGDCSKSSGNLYLSWDMRSENGRLVGTGVYIAAITYKVHVTGQKDDVEESTQTWGVKRY